ncbi:hypothetical protein WDW86_15325 [Bdellovibrionota bacterium FG-2]
MVDQPDVEVENQFDDLQLAIDSVCSKLTPEQVGVVEIRRTKPLNLENGLSLTCQVRIERAEGATAEIGSRQPLAITAPSGLALSGLTVSAPSILLVSGGPLELDSNLMATSVLARLTGRGGASVRNNQLSQFELKVEETAPGQYSLVGNRPAGSASLMAGFSNVETSLKFTGVTPEADVAVSENRGFGSLEVDTQLRGAMDLDLNANTSAQMKVKLCGNEIATVKTSANSSDRMKFCFGLPQLNWSALGARHARMAVEFVRCAGFSEPQSKILATLEDVITQGELSFNSPAGLPVDIKLGLKDVKSGDLSLQIRHESEVPCLDFNAEQSVMTGSFRYEVNCSAKTLVKGVEIGVDLEAVLAGKVQQMALAQVKANGALRVNAAETTGEIGFDGTDLRASGDISLRRLMGVPAKIGIHGAVNIATGSAQAGLILEADSSDLLDLPLDRTEPDTFLSLMSQMLEQGLVKTLDVRPFTESTILIQNVELRGAAVMLSIGDFDGSVRIENSRLFSASTSMMQPGGIWIRDVKGSVDLSDVTSSATCPISCRPLMVSGARKLTVQGGRLENLKGSVLDGDVTEIELNGVDMKRAYTGGDSFPALMIGGGPERRRLSIQGGTLEGDLIILGYVVVHMNGLHFSGRSIVSDGGSTPEGHPGAFTRDPLQGNSGLSEDRLSSATDWDGNGCVDHPSELNRIVDGACVQDGYSPPSW